MTIDYRQHNEEVRQVWDAYWRGEPIRVPVGNFTIGPRIWVQNPQLNTTGITWEQVTLDAETMFQVQLAYKYYFHHHIIHDGEMGIPEKGWDIFVELNNFHEAAWYGCDVHFPAGQVPATTPRYTGDRKRELLDRGIPDPFGGIYAMLQEHYDYFRTRAAEYEFHGKPVNIMTPWQGISTDGLLTVALDVRGEEILSDMYEDPGYYHELMTFLVEATIQKVRAWRQFLGLEMRPKLGGYADDAIQLISVETYKELVLPYHQRLLDALYDGGPFSMHLCGNVQRHFPTLIKELNINHFDTGFPIDFTTLREEIGEDVHINGGVHVDILLHGTPAQVAVETKRILQSGVTRGGKFILKEANNMPPCVPLENLWAMYDTAREFGRYQ